MDNREGKRELVSTGVMGLLVGLSLICAGVWAGRQLHIIWDIWPNTDGVVVGGAVQETLGVPYAKGGMAIPRYAGKIDLRYTVSGREYTAEAPAILTADTYEQAAAKLIQMYAAGTHHLLRYNPRDPRDIRFGAIPISSLAFSFLLLIGGVVLLAVGLQALVVAYSPLTKVVAAKPQGLSAPVLPFSDGAQHETSATTVLCPACGRPVQATEYTCPNCLKSLRAA